MTTWLPGAATSSANVTGTFTIVLENPYGRFDDDGSAGVREPLQPYPSGPPALVARKVDDVWEVLG